MQIRDATEHDLPGILAIYNHVIATSNAVYTETAATLDDRRAWLAARRADNFPVLVADDAGIMGFGVLVTSGRGPVMRSPSNIRFMCRKPRTGAASEPRWSAASSVKPNAAASTS
jgi:hypothetical protein